MSVLEKEAEIVQNPALGAIILWWFAHTYFQSSPHSEPVALPLLFIVLPIVLHEDFHEIVRSTQKRSGLRTMAEKFSKSDVCKNDVLINFNNQVLSTRELTLDSLRIAVTSNLLMMNMENALVYSLQGILPKLPKSVQDMIGVTEKIATWCAGLTLYEISLILKVRF